MGKTFLFFKNATIVFLSILLVIISLIYFSFDKEFYYFSAVYSSLLSLLFSISFYIINYYVSQNIIVSIRKIMEQKVVTKKTKTVFKTNLILTNVFFSVMGIVGLFLMLIINNATGQSIFNYYFGFFGAIIKYIAIYPALFVWKIFQKKATN